MEGEDQLKQAVSIEVATKDIERWLDSKRISERNRTRQKDEIESLISGVCDGILIVNEDATITQKLLFPINGTSELKFKNRITDTQLRPYLKNIPATDIYAQLTGYIAALTETLGGVISLLDTEDRRYARAIALFFM